MTLHFLMKHQQQPPFAGVSGLLFLCALNAQSQGSHNPFRFPFFHATCLAFLLCEEVTFSFLRAHFFPRTDDLWRRTLPGPFSPHYINILCSCGTWRWWPILPTCGWSMPRNCFSEPVLMNLGFSTYLWVFGIPLPLRSTASLFASSLREVLFCHHGCL